MNHGTTTSDFIRAVSSVYPVNETHYCHIYKMADMAAMLKSYYSNFSRTNYDHILKNAQKYENSLCHISMVIAKQQFIIANDNIKVTLDRPIS